MDVGAALICTGEPAAQQVTVRQFHHGRGVGGGVAAGGQQRLQRTHFLVFIHRAVPGQTGQFCVGHVVSSISVSDSFCQRGQQICLTEAAGFCDNIPRCAAAAKACQDNTALHLADGL